MTSLDTFEAPFPSVSHPFSPLQCATGQLMNAANDSALEAVPGFAWPNPAACLTGIPWMSRYVKICQGLVREAMSDQKFVERADSRWKEETIWNYQSFPVSWVSRFPRIAELPSWTSLLASLRAEEDSPHTIPLRPLDAIGCLDNLFLLRRCLKSWPAMAGRGSGKCSWEHHQCRLSTRSDCGADCIPCTKAGTESSEYFFLSRLRCSIRCFQCFHCSFRGTSCIMYICI